jgi:hypothetical protein
MIAHTQLATQEAQRGNTRPFNSGGDPLGHFKPPTVQVAPRAQQIMGLVELEERGFTFAQFSKVLGHDVTQYSDLSPDDAETLLRGLGGPDWREAL